jgi:parallel beta-helix repeat protein
MKSKEKRLINILMIGFIISLINMNINDFQKQKLGYDKNIEETILYELKSSENWVLIDTTIIIDDTQVGTYDWATINATYDWCNGAGTMGDPYIIENLTMIGYNYDACIKISDSSANFIIRYCTFINTDRALYITGSIYGKLVNNTFSNNWVGASFGFCQDFTISENRFNDNGVGLLISQGDNYIISNNSFKNNSYGLEMVNDVMNSLIYKNMFEDNQAGIYFYSMDGENNNISSNIMNGCGFDYYDWNPPVWASTITIETSNLVNGKPLYFYHNQLNLRSVNFTNAGQVLLIESNNTHVSDLNISNCTVGISMNLCKNNTLINSNFSNSAITLKDCYNITLNNNIVSDLDQPGIYLYYGNGYNLANNQMFDCGFSIYGNVKDMYLNNIDTSNKVNDKPLYFFINKTGLDSSTFSDAGQLILIDCKESSIRDLIFSNTYLGIDGKNCNNNTFSNITLQDNTHGLCFDNCSNNRILNCQIRDCSAYGIISSAGNINTIKECTISNCKYSGLSLDGDENIVTDNTFDANLRYGIYVDGGYNIITDNEISNNIEIGIRLRDTGNIVINNNITQNQAYGMGVSGSYHTIAQNNISNNEQHGIFLENADDNTIIENDIIENQGSGIHIFRFCDNNDIIGNAIKFNHKLGIFLDDDSNFNTIYNMIME